MKSHCYYCGHSITVDVKGHGIPICRPCFDIAMEIPPVERFRLFIEFKKATNQAEFLSAVKHVLWELGDASRTLVEHAERMKREDEGQ